MGIEARRNIKDESLNDNPNNDDLAIDQNSLRKKILYCRRNCKIERT